MKTRAYLIYCSIVFIVGLAGFIYKSMQPAWRVADLAAQGIWLEEKTSKGMLLANRKTPPDVVFIGASTTQNHTATEVFSEFGIDIFNYGLPGRNLEDSAYMVAQAIAARPKMIVIQLPSSKLRSLPCPQAPDWTDLVANMQVRGFLSDCDLIHDTLLYQIPSVRYKDFLPKYNLAVTLWFIDALRSSTTMGPVISEFQTQINYIGGKAGRYVMTLRSGDAIVLSPVRFKPSEQKQTLVASSTSPMVLAMLKYLVQEIEDAGIQPVIALIPGGSGAKVELQDLAQLGRLNVPVIQGVNFADNVDFWADGAHFDNEGRIAWSRWLAPRIRQLLDTQE